MGTMQNNLVEILKNSGRQITSKKICYPTPDLIVNSTVVFWVSAGSLSDCRNHLLLGE